MAKHGGLIDAAGLSDLLVCDERTPEERHRLIQLMELFTRLPDPPGGGGLFPRFAELREAFAEACGSDDGERVEESFLELYAHVHMHEAAYTPGERRRVPHQLSAHRER